MADSQDSNVDVGTAMVFELSLDNHADPHLVNFYEPEQAEGHTFRWSEPVAMIRLDVPASDYQVVLDTACLRGEDCPFSFTMLWNDQRIRKSAITVEHGKLSFHVNRSMFVHDGEQRLTVSCKPLNAENGRRQLGLPLKSVSLTQVGEPPAGTVAPVKSRSRMWRREKSYERVRRLLGRKSPSPTLPIWEMKLPSLSGMLPANTEKKSGEAPVGPKTDTVVVSSVEINSRHGTGLLIQYMFEDFSDIATVASRSCYDGDRVRSAVHHDLPHGKLARHEIYEYVLSWFRNSPPKQAYIVPYFKTDLLIAIALKDLFDTKLCVHYMDDNNIYDDEIPDHIMAEAIEKAELSFAISSEMRVAYEQRYGQKFYVLPPIVPEKLIKKADVPVVVPEPAVAVDVDSKSRYREALKFLGRKLSQLRNLREPRKSVVPKDPRRGILIGNVWDQKWLDMLRETVRDSGYEVDWYSNNPDAIWLNQQTEELAKDGIHLRDALWGEDLVNELRRRPFAVMPSGTLCENEPRESIARLSLPSRIPYVMSVSQLPLIVLGSKETVASRFVDRFGIGETIDYDSSQFKAAVTRIVSPESQQQIRQQAGEIAPTFSATGLEKWLWDSTHKGVPADDRFEDLFALRDGEFAYFIDSRPPKQVHWDKQELWQLLKRMQGQGYQFENIIDVGSSTGVWSWTASKVYPDSHYVLVDPMMSRYSENQRKFYQGALPRHEVVEAALSDKCGNVQFLVSDDLYGSSLLKVNDSIRKSETADVEMVTLDELARRQSWTGSTLLKIDVQFAEHLVVAGGLDFIKNHVDALILELTIAREHPEAKTYREMLDLMDSIGYELVDEMEGWRSPKDGRLEQKDAVFVRKAASNIAFVPNRAAA